MNEGREDRNLHHRLQPTLRAFVRYFPAIKTVTGPLTARYIPLAVNQTDTALEEINRDGQIGRTDRELWEDVVKSELFVD